MENIIGYICNTAWGTVSRTADSLGWVPVLPAAPDGWEDTGSGDAPAGFVIVERPGTRCPALYPAMPYVDIVAIHDHDDEPGRWSLCWAHDAQRWEMRPGVAREAAFIRGGGCADHAWEALAGYCLRHPDELDEIAHTGTAWAGYPDDWAAAADELLDALLEVLV